MLILDASVLLLRTERVTFCAKLESTDYTDWIRHSILSEKFSGRRGLADRLIALTGLGLCHLRNLRINPGRYPDTSGLASTSTQVPLKAAVPHRASIDESSVTSLMLSPACF